MGDQTSSGLKTHTTKAPIVKFYVDHLDEFKVNELRILNSGDYTNLQNLIPSPITSGKCSCTSSLSLTPFYSVPIPFLPMDPPQPWCTLNVDQIVLASGTYTVQLKGLVYNCKNILASVQVDNGGTVSSTLPGAPMAISPDYDNKVWSFTFVQPTSPNAVVPFSFFTEPINAIVDPLTLVLNLSCLIVKLV